MEAEREFVQADGDKDGFISSVQAVRLLKSSGLSKADLAQIW